MKPIPFHFSIFLVSSTLLFSSCLPKEEVSIQEADPLWTQRLQLEEWQQVETAKEFSRLLGEVMRDKESRLALSQFIQQYDDFGDAVSLSTLLGDRASMPPSELARLATFDKGIAFRKESSPLREAILEQSLANLSQYPFLERSFETFQSKKGEAKYRVSLREELIEFYENSINSI